ncbi:MAG: DUF2785 domain-containing protein [Symbiobacteriia bacterium]
MDKSFWTDVKQHDFAVPDGYLAVGLLPDLMAGLGSTDPDFRDSLCYEVVATWVEKDRFTPEDLRPMVDQLLVNLRAGIGQGENDQVFLRTFSVLILAEVVAHDAKAPFLTSVEVHRILQAGLQYLADEQDLRGFVPDKGWAHSPAHTADLLYTLAEHPALDASDLHSILQAVGLKVLAPTPYALTNHEGFRLGNAVLAVLRREALPLPYVVAWLDDLGGGGQPRSKAYVAGVDGARYHNTEALLTALHLMLTYQDVPDRARTALLPAVHLALKSFLPRFL